MTDEHPQAPDTPLLAICDGCATITLNRPAHHNRLHVEDLLALRQHFDTLLQRSDVNVLVLTGAGASFCSGFHIGSIEDGPASANAGPRLFEQTVDALEALPLPTVCRLNGSVYGGATDLALACDFRIGVDSMVLRMPAVRLGLHYYPSGMRRYVSRLGLGAAKRLFMLAETVPASELLRIGYLDRCVLAERLDGEVQTVVDALLAGAPLALRGMKASLDEIARGEFAEDALRERESRCASSDDLREGKAAFAERRAPRFQGR
jgi:enoyl-CoA hydratase/carnithine racemase